MKKNLSSVCFGVVAAVVALWFTSAVPATGQQSPAKQSWEYLFTQISQQDAPIQLNKLGEEGWELVTLERTDRYSHATFYFKRPK